MRVGIDATCWANDRGYGRFTREIVAAMARCAPEVQLVCFLDPKSAARFELRAKNVARVIVGVKAAPTDAASATGSRSLADMLRMSRAVSRQHLDAIFFPTVYTYFPAPPGLPVVVTIHDAIAERFPKLILPSRRARYFWRIKTWLALRQAGKIVTVSQYAANEVARAHGIPIDTITVAVEAPAPAYRPTTDAEVVKRAASSVGLPEGARWFTYVGGFNPHKNASAVVRAHALLAAETGAESPYLLLIGTTDSDVFHGNQAAIRAAIEAAGTAKLVRWTGYVEDNRLAALHSGAIALVLASESEGFGLPAVEAAACDTPVIATTESPLPELLEGGGVFVRPGDENALLEAMRLLSRDEALRSAMGMRAGGRARALSWDRAAEACLLAVRQAATKSKAVS